MKKNILIISIYYPPIQSIASNRIESFSKYLDKEKYNVYVHTIASKSRYELNDVEINRVQNKLLFKPLLFIKRTNKLIHYTKVLYNKFINSFFSNSYRGWIDESLKELPSYVKEKNIDIIISTFAPTAPHIVALHLKKRYPDIKWIADMRDEMSMGLNLPTKIKSVYEKLEADILHNADALISVSKPIVEEFQSMKHHEKILFREIRNGYDFEIEKKENSNKYFTITYTGNFYGDINPNNFLIALENFLSKNGNAKIKVQFVGVKTHFHLSDKLAKTVHIIPSVSHDEAIKIMKQSDALLLIHPSNGRKGVFTGKLFEYLGVLRPIIALVDEEDVAADLITQTNAGYVSDNSNIDMIQDIIVKLYDEYKDKKTRVYNVELIKKHHRKEQVKRLENLIEELENE
jgi:glycosyltransferase involved in cell wall biosynthesis